MPGVHLSLRQRTILPPLGKGELGGVWTQDSANPRKTPQTSPYQGGARKRAPLAAIAVAFCAFLGAAPSSDHWSFQKVERPPVPQVRDGSSIRNPIDAFILETLETNGLTPAPEAKRRTLIRRLSFDLIG